MAANEPAKPPIPGTLFEAAVAMNELFLTYVAAGFTRAEALQICLTLTLAQIPKPNNE